MPKLIKPLTDIQPKNARPKEKPYKLSDGAGLYLLVNPDGAKYWRMQYRFGEKQCLLSFGKYPDVSLADARKQRSAARDKMKEGICPGGRDFLRILPQLDQATKSKIIKLLEKVRP